MFCPEVGDEEPAMCTKPQLLRCRARRSRANGERIKLLDSGISGCMQHAACCTLMCQRKKFNKFELATCSSKWVRNKLGNMWTCDGLKVALLCMLPGS